MNPHIFMVRSDMPLKFPPLSFPYKIAKNSCLNNGNALCLVNSALTKIGKGDSRLSGVKEYYKNF